MPTAARTTGAGVSPHVRGRGFSPNEAETFPPTRPWHVRFRGNLNATLPKVACNSTDRTFLTTQKRWNCNDTLSIHKRLTGKFHATLLGNHDDAPYKIRPRPGQVVSAPVKGQCTRSERVHCLRIGCTTPVTSSRTSPTGGGPDRRGARIRRGRGQPRSYAQPTPASSISQTKRSTIRFANASSAVFASPLGSGASAATASSAHVRAS